MGVPAHASDDSLRPAIPPPTLPGMIDRVPEPGVPPALRPWRGRACAGGRCSLLAAALAVLASPALAAEWSPSSAMTIVAPANPGGGWDQTARMMQLALERERLVGKPVEVVNQGGAGGTIGLAELVESRRGDPHTLMIGGFGMLGAVLMHDSRHTLRDITPIARLTSEYEVVAVPAASPYRTLAELLAAFKANPKAISWAGGSAGSADHIFIALLAEKLQVDPAQINYVAFTGGGDAASAVMGGQVSAGVSGYGEWQALAAAGRIRILAVSSPTRQVSPDVPTFRELGVPLDFANWRFIVAPPGLSAAERRGLVDLIGRARASPTWQRVLRQNEWQDSFLPGDEFGHFIERETQVTQRALLRMGIRSGTGPSVVGAWFFPGLALATMALCVTILAGQALRRRRDVVPMAAAAAATATEDAAPFDLARVALACVAMLGYAAGLRYAGFLLATPPFVFGLLHLGGSRRWRRDAALALLMTAAVWLLFERGLGVKLP